MNSQPSPGDEEDPTGIRALLASLPDPGPMPPDVARRITASIEAERAALGAGEQPGPVVTPLVRRRPLWQKVGMAAAAVVVVGSVAAALTDTTPGEVTALITQQDQAVSAGDSAAEADAGAPESVPDDSRGPSLLGSDGARGSSSAMSTAWGGVVEMSGTAYASATLADQIRPTVAQWALGRHTSAAKDASQLEVAGTLVASPARLADCLAGLGIATADFVGLDVGTFVARPAAVVVARTAAGGTEAYVVGIRCSKTAPDLRDGPVGLG